MKLILTFFFLFYVSNSYCQSNSSGENKNSIRIFYAPALTKTMFEKSLEEAYPQNLGGVFFKELYNSHIPDLPMYGFLTGIDYSRRLTNQWGFGFGYRYTLKGQQSPHYFNYNGFPPNNPGYGGGSYQLSLTTNEFYIKADKKIFSIKDKLFVSLGGGLSIDIFNERILQNFIIEKETGIIGPGCCSSHNTIKTTGSYLDKMWWHLKEKHFRYGFFFTNPYNFKLTNFLYLSIVPEFEFLSKVHDDREYLDLAVVQGNIWLFNIQTGLKFMF